MFVNVERLSPLSEASDIECPHSLYALRVLYRNIPAFIRAERTGGGLGGEGLRQILCGPPHFPLQRKDQGGQVAGFSSGDPTVKVIQTVTFKTTTNVDVDML